METEPHFEETSKSGKSVFVRFRVLKVRENEDYWEGIPDDTYSS